NEGLEVRLQELERDHEIRCIILTGDERGKAFSAGANLADRTTHTVESPAAFVTGIPVWRRFVANLLTDFPKPVIAAVNGYAIGIG
ncbi:enoyl-CoA hydratase/isomerase family protein, partial [Klebsiella oxytoca]|uniref:enoyl-CoA hydratase/isomerase family protein n=1 Tax=Klebsiella oxytoca TaxID=571 RepID=UPI0013D4CCED